MTGIQSMTQKKKVEEEEETDGGGECARVPFMSRPRPFDFLICFLVVDTSPYLRPKQHRRWVSVVFGVVV